MKAGGKTHGILSSKIFLIILFGIIGLILIIIIGAVLNSGKGDMKTAFYNLKLHLDNTAEVIKDYQPLVRSSDLRSSSASLDSILSNTERELTDYLTEKYNFKENDINKKITESAQLERDELESELFNAKINGTLDRVYALKMAYEISLIEAEEEKILRSTKDETLIGILGSSIDSLTNLYPKFNNFSETK